MFPLLAFFSGELPDKADAMKLLEATCDDLAGADTKAGVAIMFLEDDVALAYVNSGLIRDTLLSSPPISFGKNLNCVCKPLSSHPSCLLECRGRNPRARPLLDTIMQAFTQKFQGKINHSYSLMDRFVFVLPNHAEACESLEFLRNYAFQMNCEPLVKSRLIEYQEITVVPAHLRQHSRAQPVNLTMEAISTAIQQKLSPADPHPLVLGIYPTTSALAMDNSCVYLLCASAIDADHLEALQSIDLSFSMSINFLSSNMDSAVSLLAHSHAQPLANGHTVAHAYDQLVSVSAGSASFSISAIVVWDTRYCTIPAQSIQQAEPVVSKALNEVLRKVAGLNQKQSLSVQQAVLVDRNNPCADSNAIGDFIVTPFSNDLEADLMIENVIESFLTMCPEGHKFVVVATRADLLVTINRSFNMQAKVLSVYPSTSETATVEILSKPNFSWMQVVNVYAEVRWGEDRLSVNSTASGLFSAAHDSLSFDTLPTRSMGMFGTSPQTKTSVLGGLDSFLAETSNQLGGLYSRNTLTSFGESTSDLSSAEHEVVVDLLSYTIAVYVEKLLLWGVNGFDALFAGLDYLLGENVMDYDHNIAAKCSIGIRKDITMGVFALTLRGKSASMVNKRAQRIQAMLSEIKGNIQVFQLLDWTANHREAITGSDVLQEQEAICSASAYFASSNGVSVVEVVAVKASQLQALWMFIKSLRPHEASFKLTSSGASQVQGSIMSRVKKMYACIAELSRKDHVVDSISLTLYGFGPSLFQQAMNHFPVHSDTASNGSGSSDRRSVTSLESLRHRALLNGSSPPQSFGMGAPGGMPRGAYAESDLSDTFSQHSLTQVPSGHQHLQYQSHLQGQLSSHMQDMRGYDGRAVEGREMIRKLHRGTYSFADREAGIFFFAFEVQFRDYLEKAYSVVVEDSDFSVQFSKGAAVSPVSSMSGGMSPQPMAYGGNNMLDLDSMNHQMDLMNKNIVLKISFYGNSMKSVSAARSYLEQLNTTSLSRIQLFFPQVHAKKYKEIYTRKASQCSHLHSMRARDLQERYPHDYHTAAIDPLQNKGFINIRMKPPMHNHGIRRMGLPADVTITICGSTLCESNVELMKELEEQFNAIPSDYIVTEMKIPYNHPMKRNLTIKALREELIAKYNLIALKWEEGSRATGSVGTAKIWASSQESMSALFAEIKAAEQELERAGMYNCNDSNECATASAASTAANATASKMINPELVNLLTQQFQSLKAVPEDPAGGPKEVKSIVYLPDLTLRYVLLAAPLNKQLNELLTLFAGHGLKIKYPYRDRNDPHATLLMEGEQGAIQIATSTVNDLISKSVKSLLSCYVIVSEEQHKVLINNDLAGVKYIQGQAGVHLKLDPVHYEVSRSTSVFDMRTYYKPKVGTGMGAGQSSTGANVDTVGGDDLLTISVRPLNNAFQCTEISIRKFNVTPDSFLSAVNGLLVLSSAPMEEDVLVHANSAIRKRVVQVQAQQLSMTRMAKALEAAAQQRLTAIAIFLPMKGDTTGADEELARVCLDSLLQAVAIQQQAAMDSMGGVNGGGLQRVVLVECSEEYVQEALAGTTAAQPPASVSPPAPQALDPGDNSALVKRVVYHLDEQYAAQRANISETPYKSLKSSAALVEPSASSSVAIKLLICNVPLPMSLLSFLLTPTAGIYAQNKYKTFLFKGLPHGVGMAVDLINLLLQQQQPQVFLAKTSAPATINTINTMTGGSASIASTITTISAGGGTTQSMATPSTQFNPNSPSFVPVGLGQPQYPTPPHLQYQPPPQSQYQATPPSQFSQSSGGGYGGAMGNGASYGGSYHRGQRGGNANNHAGSIHGDGNYGGSSYGGSSHGGGSHGGGSYGGGSYSSAGYGNGGQLGDGNYGGSAYGGSRGAGTYGVPAGPGGLSFGSGAPGGANGFGGNSYTSGIGSTGLGFTSGPGMGPPRGRPSNPYTSVSQYGGSDGSHSGGGGGDGGYGQSMGYNGGGYRVNAPSAPDMDFSAVSSQSRSQSQPPAFGFSDNAFPVPAQSFGSGAGSGSGSGGNGHNFNPYAGGYPAGRRY